MRLIDADALLETLARKYPEWYTGKPKDNLKHYAWLVYYWAVKEAPTIDAVPVETVCGMFGNEAPCNYGLFGVSVDDFMMSKCGKWCEYNCDKVPYTECWQKFFEAIEKWRKQNG